MRLNHKTILITGAGGGLGSTAAFALAQQGAHLILLDKVIPQLEKIYDAIVASGAPTPAIYPFDLAGATEAHYEELAMILQEKYGVLHGLLHSALAFSHFTPLSQHKTKDWLESIHVNVTAPFVLTRVLLPILQNSNHATIVFTSDASARLGKAYSGAYGVSKIALEGMAKILAEELDAAGKIRVNTLIPGAINSPFRKKAYPAEDKNLLPSMTCLNALYVDLFSDDSLAVNGQVIDATTFNPQ